MSAVAGILHFDGEPVPSQALDAMRRALAHRGADGEGTWTGPGVGLVHLTMRTTPESMEEAQPVASPDGHCVLLLDGRVDNGPDLRRLLPADAAPRNRSDAELALQAYLAWGADCIRRIEGDFALVVWNSRTRELLCARDRLGHKPFYYCHLGRRFAFASELQALFAVPWVPRAPNAEVLEQYIAADWKTRDDTLWRDVSRLPAACVMRVADDSARREVYWRPDPEATLAHLGEADLVECYRDLLEDSIARAARSHRPVAIEVSGGLDSSAVLAVAAGLRARRRLPAPGIFAATMTFDDPAADERTHARAAAAQAGVGLHEVPGSTFPDAFYAERAAALADFPGFPNAWMRVGLLDLAHAHGCHVALTGEGGDAWLGGTRAYYAEEMRARRWRRLSQCFAHDAQAYGRWRAMRWAARHGVLALVGPARARRRLLDQLDDAFAAQVMESIERIAASRGMELRHPLQDFRLVEMAFAMPERMRLRGRRGKYLHVRAMEGRLPASVLERGDKADFSALMRAQLMGLRDDIAGLPARRPGWVAEGRLQALYAELLRGPEVAAIWPLWAIHGCDLALPLPVARIVAK